MDTKDIMKRAAAGAAVAGALGFGFLGVSNGVAGAKPGNPGPHPNPHGPGVSAPAHAGNNGNGAANGHGNGNQGTWNGDVNDDVNGDVNDDADGGVSGDVDGRMGGTWNGGNVMSSWLPGLPPGQNPFGPPGQVKQMTDLTFRSALNLGNNITIPAGTVLPNPFFGINPGQWGSVNLANAWNTAVATPTAIRWLAPGALTPQPLVWNAATGQWGVTTSAGFQAYPLTLPAPMG